VQSALRDCLLVIPLGIMTGTACAAFLWSLDAVTKIRMNVSFLLYLLPLAGVGISWMYTHFGRSTNGGNDLVITAIRSAGTVPRRMAAVIFSSTLITHLFGGSAGREGTAVQMGAGLASVACGFLELSAPSKQTLLLSGVAAGFGGVFGTPLAGAIFGLEMIVRNRPPLWILIPSTLAAYISDWTCQRWGITHTTYSASVPPTALPGGFSSSDALLFIKIIGAAVLFGLAAKGFAKASHLSKRFVETHIVSPYVRPLAGGFLVITLATLVDDQYLGLGTFSIDPSALTISSFFTSTHLSHWPWFWKMVFTICTLSFGFKGGEVTPLFFIGASLGHTISEFTLAPYDLFAALGLISVFAAASHTPVACAVMGCELFGVEFSVYFLMCCFVAHWVCGRSTIYRSQSDSAQPIGFWRSFD
jgi:H+/Cl- antiporter ClcA